MGDQQSIGSRERETMENRILSCPHCGSDNTASVPLVYKRGHATGTATQQEIVGYEVETKTTTYSDGSKETEETGRHAVYGDVTRPTYTITDLAREIAPPQEPNLIQREHNTMTNGCLAFGCLMPILMLILEYVVYRMSGISGMTNLLCWLLAAIIIWKLWNDRRNTNAHKIVQAKKNMIAQWRRTTKTLPHGRSVLSACAAVISSRHNFKGRRSPPFNPMR